MDESLQNVIIEVTGMNCENCAARVKAALAAVSGVKEVHVSLVEKQARVRAAANVGAGKLMEAVKGAGFRATGFSKDAER